VIALALLFGWCIFFIGSDFAAIQGRYARELDLPGSALTAYVPVIATLCYALAVFGLRRVKKASLRWTGFALATVAGFTINIYPVEVLERGSVAIPLSGRLTKQTLGKFDAVYPVNRVIYSSSSEGPCVRVRRDDYSEAMAFLLKSWVASQPRKDE